MVCYLIIIMMLTKNDYDMLIAMRDAFRKRASNELVKKPDGGYFIRPFVKCCCGNYIYDLRVHLGLYHKLFKDEIDELLNNHTVMAGDFAKKLEGGN